MTKCSRWAEGRSIGAVPAPFVGRWFVPTLSLFLLAAAAPWLACRQETILIAPPADTTHSGGGGGGGGTVQRAPLAITVRMYPVDSAVWNALGWVAGLVPRATVTVQRDGSSDPAVTGGSDSSGVV